MVKSLLSDDVYGYKDEISILTAVQQEARIQVEKLITELYDKWKDLIQWTVPSDKVKDESEMHRSVIKISTDVENPDLLEKVVIGMKKMNILEDSMKKFGDRLFVYVIQPLIENRKCEVFTTDSGASKVLTVEVSKSTAEEINCPDPEDMFSNLDKVFRFLHANLLHVVIGEVSGDDESSQSTLMRLLGGLIANESLDLAVKQCLIKAIPSSHKDLEQFDSVIMATTEIQKRLMDIGFIQPDNSILPDYVQNVNTLFANKKCQEILERARVLMTVEVHNTVKVSHEKPLGELPPLTDAGGSGGKKARKAELAAESPLSTNTFRLPACLIRSVVVKITVQSHRTVRMSDNFH